MKTREDCEYLSRAFWEPQAGRCYWADSRACTSAKSKQSCDAAGESCSWVSKTKDGDSKCVNIHESCPELGADDCQAEKEWCFWSGRTCKRHGSFGNFCGQMETERMCTTTGGCYWENNACESERKRQISDFFHSAYNGTATITSHGIGGVVTLFVKGGQYVQEGVQGIQSLLSKMGTVTTSVVNGVDGFVRKNAVVLVGVGSSLPTFVLLYKYFNRAPVPLLPAGPPGGIWH
jgi:hypothetical protein